MQETMREVAVACTLVLLACGCVGTAVSAQAPLDCRARLDRARHLLEAGQFKEASSAADEAVRALRENYADALMTKGRAEAALGNADAAKAAFDESYRVRPPKVNQKVLKNSAPPERIGAPAPPDNDKLRQGAPLPP